MSYVNHGDANGLSHYLFLGDLRVAWWQVAMHEAKRDISKVLTHTVAYISCKNFQPEKAKNFC